MKRIVLVTVMVMMACWAASAQAAPGGNSAAAQSCHQGGYANQQTAGGGSFGNAGQCTSYFAHRNAPQPPPPPGTVPLTTTSACTTFDDFANYSFEFGPGATPGLTSLTYTYTPDAGQGPASGTISQPETYATTTPGYPNSYVRSSNLTETAPGTYTFDMRIEVGLTPGTLTVSDGTNSATTVVPDGAVAPGCF